MKNINVEKGQKLWSKAKQIIPGGNGLLSKRPERYASQAWPVYFDSAKGIRICDIDGNEYIDMAQMGIGSAILGYADDAVDKAVINNIKKGINATLNCPEEVKLAEILLELNKFAGGVKFARTGGEAMAIAVRIARASSGKDKIAISGYHGWCDWYLATNLSGADNLQDHLLPGLEPKGVPKGLKNSVFPFVYNKPEQLIEIVNKEDIGIIVFEGARYDFPSKEFLDEIKKIAKEKNIITVIDEITSGWRMTDGGYYKLADFVPDIVVYGKAMGNGYPIAAIVGKKEVMDVAQESFISSTFWTERVGFTAAISTIEKLLDERVWEHLIKIGNLIGEIWKDKSYKYNLDIKVTDFKPLVTFKFNYGELNSALSTLFTQEMLKHGYLAANSVYVSYAHSEETLEQYSAAVDKVFSTISKSIEENKTKEILEVDIRDEGFKRLT